VQIAEQVPGHSVRFGLPAQAGHQLGIAGDPVQLGHGDGCTQAAGGGLQPGQQSAGAVNLAAGFHLGELGHEHGAALGGQLLDLGALGL